MRNGGAKDRNIGGGSCMNAALTVADAFHAWVHGHYGPLRNAAKLLARDANVSPRTAENYLHGRHAPSGDALVTLMARNAELRAEIDRLIEQRKTR